MTTWKTEKLKNIFTLLYFFLLFSYSHFFRCVRCESNFYRVRNERKLLLNHFCEFGICWNFFLLLLAIGVLCVYCRLIGAFIGKIKAEKKREENT